jgi:hypothetical protein
MLNVTPNAFANARPVRPMSTRGGGVVLRARRGETLSLEEIAAHAPAVFADEAHASRSARYEYTDTRDVLNGLIREGFRPVEVRQGGSRIEGKAGFTKHMVRLTTPGGAFQVEPRVGDISSAQIVLRNSHDGTSSYQLNSGFERWICTNGMTTGEEFETFRIGHTKGARDKVIDAAFRVVEEFPRAVEEVRALSGRNLSQGEQLAFARAALMLRWEPEEQDDGSVKAPPVDAETLIQPRRALDAGNSLWLTMNRAQEGLIRGGQRYRHVIGEGRSARVQRRTVGAVNSIDQDSKINRALWTLAAEMERLKAA